MFPFDFLNNVYGGGGGGGGDKWWEGGKDESRNLVLSLKI